ncbi:MAG: NAD(P)-binding protein, partial [Exiguobacterium sp.]|nr:NAD(P)-binding protein [Exiguobacterium sp.]
MTSVGKSVIVIGGGLGGLSAAISLAQKGYDVSLYEQNDHIGGKVNRLEQDGFGFDLGPSILTMPHIFDKLFRGSGKRMEDYVSIKRLELEWRSFFPDDTVLDLYHDLEQMQRANPSLSRKDMQEYRELLNYAARIYKTTEKGYLAEGFESPLEAVMKTGIFPTLFGFDLTSTM